MKNNFIYIIKKLASEQMYNFCYRCVKFLQNNAHYKRGTGNDLQSYQYDFQLKFLRKVCRLQIKFSEIDQVQRNSSRLAKQIKFREIDQVQRNRSSLAKQIKFSEIDQVYRNRSSLAKQIKFSEIVNETPELYPFTLHIIQKF